MKRKRYWKTEEGSNPKRHRDGSFIPPKIKSCGWHDKHMQELERMENTIKDNPGYKVGYNRMEKIVTGYLDKFNVTNFQFSNIEHIVPTSYHLIFPEIYGRLSEEIKHAVGCFHDKKSAYLISDRGVGKTFTACLYLANLLMNVPAGYEVALCGVQMIHATNLLATISAIIDMYDGKKVFDRLPKTGIEKMVFWRNGKQTMIRCYPGKGESFRGNNNVKYVLLDEFAFADLEFVIERLLPHYLRFEMGSYNTSTPGPSGCVQEVFYKTTPLMEVKHTTRICHVCSKLPSFEDRKKCNHCEVPDQPNQDDSMRATLCAYSSEEVQAREYYGDRYKTPDHLFKEREHIEKFFESDNADLKNPSTYIISIDPNQCGDSENAIVILAVLDLVSYGRNTRKYVIEYMNSFKSNVPEDRKKQFFKDINVFLTEINKTRTKTYIFVESNTGNLGPGIKNWINNNGAGYYVKVIFGRKWDKRLNKYVKAGYAKTNSRTKRYVDVLCEIFERQNVKISKNLKTDFSLPYNSINEQKKKLKDQLLRFRLINKKYTGKIGPSGSVVNDDLAIAFMAGIYMSEELFDSSNKLNLQTMDWDE